MPSPVLIVRRVVVDGELSCDEKLYPGLNVIQAVQVGQDPRSTNGCGKTSLVELIQHGLGRQHSSKAKFHFAPIVEKLQTLWLEIETQNGVFTIERSLQNIFGVARIHQGVYMPGMEASPAEVVPMEEMSHVMLSIVGIPEVSVNTQQGQPAPLSFPLLMRAFVLHQEDSFAEILFKVQPETRKTDIIGFLTSITPLERFPVEAQISDLMQQLEPLDNYVAQVTRFLIDRNVPSLIEAEAQVRNAQEELERSRREQQGLQRQIIEREAAEKVGQTDEIRHKLLAAKQETASVEQSLLGIQQESLRLEELVASLRGDRQKSIHLQASTIQLNHVDFDLCPRCLQGLTVEMRQREQGGRCSLCNRPLARTSDSPPRRVTKADDVDQQIEEAETVLNAVQAELGQHESRLGWLRDIERDLSADLEKWLSVYVSPAVDQLNAQANLISEHQAELAEARYVKDQADALTALQTQLDSLNLRLAELQDERDEVSKARKQRREEFRQAYAEVLRAVDFPALRDVRLDAQTLMPIINEQLYIHQGTALKGLATVCYHLALLALARTQDTYFPKMLVIDSPNAGDLNEENHAKLLRYLASLDSPNDESPDWQIILTTRHLPTELEPFVRDRISSPDKMLLRKRSDSAKVNKE